MSEVPVTAGTHAKESYFLWFFLYNLYSWFTYKLLYLIIQKFMNIFVYSYVYLNKNTTVESRRMDIALTYYLY